MILSNTLCSIYYLFLLIPKSIRISRLLKVFVLQLPQKEIGRFADYTLYGWINLHSYLCLVGETLQKIIF
jgi:hypothetical protein